MEGAFLGIDIGTSGCKSLLLASDGSVLGAATSRYGFEQPREGWAEQDPQIWRAGVRDSVGKLIHGTDARILCVGLSGQMHGMTALDASHRVIRPAILWNDQRNAAECDKITEMAGGLSDLIGLVNNRMLPGFTGGKILWFAGHEPKDFARTKVILNPKDYLRLLLTGEIATEVSDASGTGLFDVVKRRWCSPLTERIGLDRSLLPPVLESTQVTGQITDSASDEFGIPAGTPVIGGGGDAVIQTLGSGVCRTGTLQTTIGTAGIVATTLDAPMENRDGRVQISCNVLPASWHCMGVSLNAGGALSWWRESHVADVSQLPEFGAMAEMAAQAPPGADGLLFLPYLMGERCPWPDPLARGGFVGLRSHHRLAHLHRAVFEGIVYSLRDMANHVDSKTGAAPKVVHASGGGASLSFWCRLQADIFGARTVVTQNASQGGAFGAALLAGIASGAWHTSNIDKICAIEAEWQPNRDLAHQYDRHFAVYRTLYESLRAASHRLSDLMTEAQMDGF